MTSPAGGNSQDSLGLYVGLLSYGVGDLLAVVVLLLGFGQLFD